MNFGCMWIFHDLKATAIQQAVIYRKKKKEMIWAETLAEPDPARAGPSVAAARAGEGGLIRPARGPPPCNHARR
jgi:hypothetical protein